MRWASLATLMERRYTRIMTLAAAELIRGRRPRRPFVALD